METLLFRPGMEAVLEWVLLLAVGAAGLCMLSLLTMMIVGKYGTLVQASRSLTMPNDVRHSELIATFEATGCTYIAQGLVEGLASTLTASSSCASELAKTAAAKAKWDAAERALTEYQASH